MAQQGDPMDRTARFLFDGAGGRLELTMTLAEADPAAPGDTAIWAEKVVMQAGTLARAFRMVEAEAFELRLLPTGRWLPLWPSFRPPPPEPELPFPGDETLPTLEFGVPSGASQATSQPAGSQIQIRRTQATSAEPAPASSGLVTLETMAPAKDIVILNRPQDPTLPREPGPDDSEWEAQKAEWRRQREALPEPEPAPAAPESLDERIERLERQGKLLPTRPATTTNGNGRGGRPPKRLYGKAGERLAEAIVDLIARSPEGRLDRRQVVQQMDAPAKSVLYRIQKMLDTGVLEVAHKPRFTKGESPYWLTVKRSEARRQQRAQAIGAAV